MPDRSGLSKERNPYGDSHEQTYPENTLSGQEKGFQTQLALVVQQIRQIWDAEPHILCRRPWLPPLKEQIVLPQEPEDAHGREADLTIPVGWADLPERQRQETYRIDLRRDGNLLFLAAPGFGKSLFLTTALLALAMKNPVDLLQIYLLDFGSSSLSPLKQLCHTADYIAFDDEERFRKFRRILEEELQQRKKSLAEPVLQNFEAFHQVSQEKRKVLLIAFDNMDALREYGPEAEEFFSRMLRDGNALGIYFLCTATRSGALRYASFNSFRSRICGFVVNPTDVILTTGRTKYPQSEVRGRAFVSLDGMVCSMQIYTACAFESQLEYREGVETLIHRINGFYPGEKAPSIPVLPEHLTYKTFLEYLSRSKKGTGGPAEKGGLPEHRPGENFSPVPADMRKSIGTGMRSGRSSGIGVRESSVQKPGQIWLGLDTEYVQPCGMTAALAPFLIIGESGRGRTHVLRILLDQCLGKSRIFLLDAKSMDLYAFRERAGVTYLNANDISESADSRAAEDRKKDPASSRGRSDDPKAGKCFFGELRQLLTQREAQIRKVLQKGYGKPETEDEEAGKEKRPDSPGSRNPRQIAATLSPVWLLIDDADDLIAALSSDNAGLTAVAEVLERCVHAGVGLAVTVNAGKFRGYDPISRFLRNASDGLVLGSQGTAAVFPLTSLKELPAPKEGLLWHN